MAIFKLNPDKPVDPISTIIHDNFPTVEADPNTEFGIINPDNNKILQYNKVVKSDDTDNSSKDIRITLTGQAIRSDKYNSYDGLFDTGYPENDVYSFCNPETATIYQHSVYQFTRKSNINGYPNAVDILKVKDSVQNNQYGSSFSLGSECLCPSGLVPDPVTGKCTTKPKCVVQTRECPDFDLPTIKNTIYGYAFYLTQPQYTQY